MQCSMPKKCAILLCSASCPPNKLARILCCAACTTKNDNISVPCCMPTQSWPEFSFMQPRKQICEFSACIVSRIKTMYADGVCVRCDLKVYICASARRAPPTIQGRTVTQTALDMILCVRVYVYTTMQDPRVYDVQARRSSANCACT